MTQLGADKSRCYDDVVFQISCLHYITGLSLRLAIQTSRGVMRAHEQAQYALCTQNSLLLMITPIQQVKQTI